MKILLVMDPGIPVPPPLYGGHERLVAMFAREYTRLGHEVSVLSGPGSETPGKNYFFGKNDLKRSSFQRSKELFYAWIFLFKRRRDFDLIHNFGRLLYLLPVLSSKVCKIMSYGRKVAPAGIKQINRFHTTNLLFTACSDYCVGTGNVAGEWRTIYNAIDFSSYQLRPHVPDDAPLMFLGRLDRLKGAHTAIQVALRTGRKLWIGGNIPDTPDNFQYYKEELEPKFDGEQIVYLGALNDEQKNQYLGQASVLLFPIEGSEAFGLVMAEAMACGTPVIGFGISSVPEVITNGITGFSVQTVEEMINAIPHARQLDRVLCREHACKRFDLPVIAAEYLSLFNLSDD